MLTIIETSACYVTARVEFNAIPVIDDDFTEITNGSMKIDHWAVDGSNALRISLAKVAPGDPKIDHQTAERKRRFELILKRVPRGASGESGEELVRFSSREAGIQPIPLLAPVFEQTFPLSVVQHWKWVSARRLEGLPQASIPGLTESALAFQIRLETKDLDGVIAMQRDALAELAIASEMNPEDFLERYRAFLSERMGSPGWKVRSLLAGEITPKLMADGRVVHATRQDGSPLFWTASEHGPFWIDPYFANINHEWAIIR